MGVTHRPAPGEEAGAVAAHEAASDPHPVYTTAAELAAAIAVHEGAGDPHPSYLTQAEGDARYAFLTHSHAISDVTGLQTALDGKSDVGHSHSGLAPSGGTTNQVLKKNSNTDYDYSWQADATGGGVSDGDKGDITVSASGATWTIDPNAVDNAKLRDSSAVSVIGRSANSSGDPADIAAGENDRVLRRVGDALGFGQLTVGMAPDKLWTYAKLQDVSATARALGRKSAGVGVIEELTLSELLDFIGSAAEGDILYRGASNWARLAKGSNGDVLTLASNVPSWAAPGAGGGQSLVKYANLNGAGIAVSNSDVSLGSKALTIAAGEQLIFEVNGRIHNNAGATRTYTFSIRLGAVQLDVVASTTLAANTISAFVLYGCIGIVSTSSVMFNALLAFIPATTDNGAAATAVSRHSWRTSASNLTGAQTAQAQVRSSGTGTQTAWVHGMTIRQMGAI